MDMPVYTTSPVSSATIHRWQFHRCHKDLLYFYLALYKQNESSGSTERRAINSQFFLLCNAFAKEPTYEI